METDHNWVERSQRVFNLHWIKRKIRIYVHVILDIEKYRNICICDITVHLYVTLGKEKNQNLSTHDNGYKEI